MANSNKFSFDETTIGILRLQLAETIPAFALREIIAIIQDLYFARLWLSRAEAWNGKYSFPDEYAPTEDETLYVFRLEIGTPNSIDLMGLFPYIVPALALAGSVFGLMTAPVLLAKTHYEAKKLKIETEKLEIEKEKLTYERDKLKTEAEIKQLELRRLLKDAERDASKLERRRIEIQGIDFGLEIPAKRLRAKGKISDAALKHKTQMEKEIRAKSIMSLQNYTEHPTLIIIPYEEK